MSVFIPVVEQPRHARPKPDLRLAESYIPALVLYIKCIGYTCIAPIILLMQWRLTVLCIAAFALLLYVDHLYLSNGVIPFIDTTALCLDVFGATLLMLAISILRPCSQQCQGVLAVWTLLSSVYVVVSPLVSRPIAHICTFILALLFIYADTGSTIISLQQGGASSSSSIMMMMNQTLFITNISPPPLSFFFRTTMYVILGLIDIYLFRPLFQQENERLLFCKYAPVLLGSWPWYIIFGLLLGTSQLIKHFQLVKLPHVLLPSYNNASSSGSNPTPQHISNNNNNNALHLNNNNNNHLLTAYQSSSSSSSAHYHHNDGASTLVQHTFTIPTSFPSSSSSSSMMTNQQPTFGVSLPKNIQDLDIMEAFRLAKEQRMGAKGAN